MATKLVRAQDILREKGFALPPFDTQGFTDAVTRFFRSGDVSASLCIFAVRFVDYGGAPASGFAASTDWARKEYDDYHEEWFFHYPIPTFAGGLFPPRYIYDDNTVFHPFILVDEPYMANAVGLLKLMGYVVSRPRKQLGLPCRQITLV